MPAPIEGNHYLTQGYGKTQFSQSPLGQKLYKAWGGEHKGLDFGTGGLNLPVISTCAGTVVRASMNGGWGNHVEVKGIDGWNRQYAHLFSMEVKVGDKVITGTRLGRVGTTGSSTAVHLHWGHRKSKLMGGWEYRDPSSELTATTQTAKMPSGKLIKSNSAEEPGVYLFNGKSKFLVPDGETLVFLFGKEGWGQIELVEHDIISKIPQGLTLPSLR